MTPNATYNDIKTHLAKPNEIEAVTNIEASSKDYVIRKNAKNFIKSGKEYVKLFETVQENMDKLTPEMRAEIKAIIGLVRAS